jgi:hypothetical protein
MSTARIQHQASAAVCEALNEGLRQSQAYQSQIRTRKAPDDFQRIMTEQNNEQAAAWPELFGANSFYVLTNAMKSNLTPKDPKP